MAAAQRPIPRPDDATAAYWEAARNHELRMQACAGCGQLRFPPRPMCPDCGSLECTWQPVSGRGEIYSFVICHPPVLPAFADRAPYAVALIELAESPMLRVVGNVLDADPAELSIGRAVEVAFEEVDHDVVLPQWRLV
jgi:uncharacterized OB-fold protein